MNENTTGRFKSFLPLLIIFVIASVIPVVFRNTLVRLNIDQGVVITGNLILFAVAAISYVFYRKALNAGNTQVFLRHFYSGMLLKFMACLMAVLIYVLTVGKDVNKGGLFCLMGLYMIYTFLEIALLMKHSNQIKLNKDA